MNGEKLPIPALEAFRFLIDDEIRPFWDDQRQDLTAISGDLSTGGKPVPQNGNGQFIVHDHRVPEKMGEIVLGVVPHCWVRTDPGGAEESVRLMTPIEVAGWVLFSQSKGKNQPFDVSTNYNTPIASGVPKNNGNRSENKAGTTFLPVDPWQYLQLGSVNQGGGIYLPAGTSFQVFFELIPQAAPPTGPAQVMQIGAGDPGWRLDFAGAAVFGLRLPQDRYEDLLKLRRRGGWSGG